MYVVYFLTMALLIGFPYYGLRKGSSVLLVTGLCIAIFWGLASLLIPVLASVAPLGGAHVPKVSVGIWSIILFFPVVILAIPLGIFLDRFLQWTFDPFDWLVGVVIGCIIGFTTARIFLHAVLGAYSGTPEQALLESQFIVRQVYYLDGWDGLVRWITGLHRPEPLSPE
jgi:hypothetical protein